MSILKVTGTVTPPAAGHFKQRMTNFPDVFEEATGERLIPGTLNVSVGSEIPIKEHFRIRGLRIGEPEQDLLFEVCRIDGFWAYRIRPYILSTGGGGNGDRILEISSSTSIPNNSPGTTLTIEFFR